MNKRGLSWLGLIIGIVVVALIVTVIIFIFKHGDGNGNDGTQSAAEPAAVVDSGIKEVEVMVVTIKGNEYYYENNKIDFEGIKKILDEHESLSSVEIIDEEASEKAYRELTEYLKTNNIQIIDKGADSIV